MGTFSRVRYVIAANTNALLEKAEDPEKLLRALIREMEDAGEDARLAVADLLAEQDHLSRLDGQLGREVTEWQDRAEQAIDADRDDLARAAIKARTELEERRHAATLESTALAGRLTQLETDMNTLKIKLAEAKTRLREMHTRQKNSTSARPGPDDRLTKNERKIRNAMGRFDRLQGQVERLEARVRSYEVGGTVASPWTASEAPSDPLIEAELEKLKAKVSGKTPATAKPAETAPAAESE